MVAIRADTIQVHVGLELPESPFEHLLLKRSETDGIYPGLWQVVTGTIEGKESAIHAASRELLEETGIQADTLVILPIIGSLYNPESDTVHMIPVFGLVLSRKTHVVLSNEHSNFGWYSLDEALKRVHMPSHREGLILFDHHVHSKPVSPVVSVSIPPTMKR